MSLMEIAGPAAESVEAFVAPASFGQERFWVMDRMDPGKAAWSLPLTLRLRGALDIDALREALTELSARHESLRTVLRWMDGGLAQVILPTASLPLRMEPAAGETPEAREADARRSVMAEIARPFDLERGPLVRARLYRVDADHHLFLLILHHAVTDGWSNGILVRELAALYGAFARGEASPLPEPELQYADFAEWQREQMTGALLERQLAWWRGALAGAPALLELPADRPRPPVHDGRGATEPVRIPGDVAAGVHALARAHGATPFMVLLAAFQALLARWARQESVVVGTPVAGRPRPETRDVVGYFVNTLALRADLGGDPSFDEILRRVRESVLGAFGNQDLPFERLVDDLNVPRSAAHAPVFQAMFVLQNTPDAPLAIPGLTVEGVEMDGGTSPFDLRLGLVEHAGELRGGVQYATALFDAETVRGMVAQFRTLLAAACANPSLRLSRLPLLSEDEARAVLAIGNETDAGYAAEPIHRLVAAQAARTPHAPAVASRGETLTYADLDARSNRLAHHLVRLGVGRGDAVAISMERSASLLVAMLAVWKAGAAYVPIDPAYPEDRRAYMLADSAAAVVLTDAASADGIPATAARTVVIDRIDLAAGAETAVSVDVDADDLAYVIYTSGSTGRPKGVMVPHRGVASFLASMAREPGLTADDVLVAVTSLSFDIAVLELLLPLVRGAKVVVATREEAMDAGRLSRLLESERATAMQATPATWRLLAASGWAGDARLAILCGGEALAPDLARELLPRGRALWNLYGPTETTIWSTVQRVESAERIHLGGPIANTRVHVLDDALRPCPAGVPGELFIGGHGVVRGYLRRPSLTAGRFVPDPYGATPGARMYRTGDLVRRRADGALEFLGRTDFQVKVRGFRIELGEIEARLAEHPSVAQAVAAVRPDASGDARLVAYVVPRGDAPGADVLRRALAERLPDHMVPSAYVVLDALPLTPNGKVDRRALPAPEARRDLAGGFVAPGTEAETTIAALWREVLGTDRVGVEDNFFDLGGNSMSLIRLARRLAQSMGSTATAVDLFRFPTVRAQAAYLRPEAESTPAPATGDSAERMRQGQSKLAMLRGMKKG
ncbi:MAG TPA: amino acid adenylation domain-containing protein [Longimicrobium sp.]|nr:amino acid adenylation domain-containing protein [Longimicrobium sp.]